MGSKGRLSDEQRQFLLGVIRLGHCAMVGIGWYDILSKVDRILFSQEPALCNAPAIKHNGKPGQVIWMDDKGRYLKRRPKVGTSVFLY